MSERKTGAAREYPHALQMIDTLWPRWHKLKCTRCSYHETVHRTNLALAMHNAPRTCTPPTPGPKFKDPALNVAVTGVDVRTKEA